MALILSTSLGEGPANDRVGTNLRRWRASQRITTLELARRMAGLGTPLGATAISKIETMGRRVDCDELVALAVATGCTPADLLMPEVVSPLDDLSEQVPLTPALSVSVADAWAWAAGRQPAGVALARGRVMAP